MWPAPINNRDLMASFGRQYTPKKGEYCRQYYDLAEEGKILSEIYYCRKYSPDYCAPGLLRRPAPEGLRTAILLGRISNNLVGRARASQRPFLFSELRTRDLGFVSRVL